MSMQAGGSVEHVALLFLAPYLSGAEHQTLALAQHLSRRCRVSLLVADETAAVIRHASAGCAGPSPRCASFPWGRHLRRCHCTTDCWHLPNSKARDAPLLARKRSRKSCISSSSRRSGSMPPSSTTLRFPTVVTMAGELRYARLRFYSRLRRAILRHATWHADAIIACSNDERLALHRMGWDRGAHVVTLDNFTDPERFRPPLAAGNDTDRLHGPMATRDGELASSSVRSDWSERTAGHLGRAPALREKPRVVRRSGGLDPPILPRRPVCAPMGKVSWQHRVQALVAHHRLNSVLRLAHTADISGESGALLGLRLLSAFRELG